MRHVQNQLKFLSYVSPRLQELSEEVLDMRETASYEVQCTAYNRSVTHSRPYHVSYHLFAFR